jgi:hypothetical protein
MVLEGRSEKRVPIALPIYLTKFQGIYEKALTQNVSSRGARVVTKISWRKGEQPQMCHVANEFNLSARVIYCHPLQNQHFCVGLQFRQPIPDWWAKNTAELRV